MRITGMDYAGNYQEDFASRAWRHMMAKHPQLRSVHTSHGVPNPTVTIYSPLLVDWAGSKISKSLYVKQGAYQYLKAQGADYLLSVSRMKELGRDPLIILDEVSKWVDDPKCLFTRSYSVEYIHSLYTKVLGAQDLCVEGTKERVEEDIHHAPQLAETSSSLSE
jgi:hypothetical protein